MNILNCAISDFTKLTPNDSNNKPNWVHIYSGSREGSIKTINNDYFDYYYNDDGKCIVTEAV